jgi:hypothetical protein
MKHKKALFLAGLFSGIVISKNWRILSKEGIKAGVRAGRKVREFSQRALEDVEDVTAEAMEELGKEQQQQEAVGDR